MTDRASGEPDAGNAAVRGAPRDTVRVYINGRGVDARATGTVADAVRALDPAAADELLAGARALVDSRGLPAEPTASVHGGAIFRLVSVRSRGAGEAGTGATGAS